MKSEIGTPCLLLQTSLGRYATPAESALFLRKPARTALCCLSPAQCCRSRWDERRHGRGAKSEFIIHFSLTRRGNVSHPLPFRRSLKRASSHSSATIRPWSSSRTLNSYISQSMIKTDDCPPHSRGLFDSKALSKPVRIVRIRENPGKTTFSPKSPRMVSRSGLSSPTAATCSTYSDTSLAPVKIGEKPASVGTSCE